MSWIRSAEAAKLLDSCAAHPPPFRGFACRFQETEIRFIGKRAARLRRLYRMGEPPIDTPAWRQWLALDPQRAIAQAIRRPPPQGAKRTAGPVRTHPHTASAPNPILSTATVS